LNREALAGSGSLSRYATQKIENNGFQVPENPKDFCQMIFAVVRDRRNVLIARISF